ncbi:RHS repeat-associated core domain-containing protein [Saccharopolyspora shandongensis]|uniref:RHS repeat-associated core domain-containing protein n=1 Tax=Saccharopolyspora shandongensis TaxID=418495 RepID=UPI0033EE7EA7
MDIGGETASFNERNQLLSRGGVDYTYTPRGTLASQKSAGISTEVVFNAFDELVSDGTNVYAHDALNRVVSADGGPVAYAGRSLDVAAEGGSLYSYLPSGEPLGVSTAGTPGVAVTNQHTDLVGVVDPGSGGLSGWRTFTPLGLEIEAQGVRPGLGFQHQYTDPGTGRVNMGSRWYQPGTGTFTSRDQAGLDPRDVGNANRFAYAGSSPLNHTDPTGQWLPIAIHLGIEVGFLAWKLWKPAPTAGECVSTLYRSDGSRCGNWPARPSNSTKSGLKSPKLDDVMYVARARLHDGSLTQDEFLLLQSVDEVISSANEFESICEEIALKESASWRELRAAARLARSELEQSWR